METKNNADPAQEDSGKIPRSRKTNTYGLIDEDIDDVEEMNARKKRGDRWQSGNTEWRLERRLETRSTSPPRRRRRSISKSPSSSGSAGQYTDEEKRKRLKRELEKSSEEWSAIDFRSMKPSPSGRYQRETADVYTTKPRPPKNDNNNARPRTQYGPPKPRSSSFGHGDKTRTITKDVVEGWRTAEIYIPSRLQLKEESRKPERRGPPKAPRKTKEDRIAEIKARFPDWVQIAERDPEWLANTLKEQEEREARETRYRERLEEWLRTGPMPRTYVRPTGFLQGFTRELNAKPYPDPSDEDLTMLRARLESTNCSVGRSEPVLVSMPGAGFKLLITGYREDAAERLTKILNAISKDVTSFMTKPGQFRSSLGFHAEYLQYCGALEVFNLQPPNLTTDIHPIFVKDNFHNISDEVYEVMMPALQLATNFIRHPACSSYWLSILYAPWEIDEAESQKAGGHMFRIRERIPFSFEAMAGLQRELFLPLARRLVIRFSHGIEMTTFMNSTHADDHIWGCTFPVYGSESDDRADPMMTLNVNKDFETVAQKYAAVKTGHNPAERMRFNFLLAVTMAHEVGHAARYVCARRKNLISSMYSMTEPFMFDNEVAEVGVSWERDMFGGTIDGIESRADGLYGVQATVVDERSITGKFTYAIPMGYIEEIQRQETWDRASVLQEYNYPGAFRIPCLSVPALSGVGMVMREPLSNIIARKSIVPSEDNPWKTKEDQLIGPFIPFDQNLAHLSRHERQILLIQQMVKPVMTDEELIAVWELWWQYESIGFQEDLEMEKKWHLAESMWRLAGGRSSTFTNHRSNQNSMGFLPDRFNPRVMGSWGDAEIKELLEKRKEVLGIPVQVPWDKYEDNDSSNSDDKPPHLRTETEHHPGGYDPPESPFKNLLGSWNQRNPDHQQRPSGRKPVQFPTDMEL